MSHRSRRFGLVIGCLLLGALPAAAGDGVREINQACAAVGCWPGDDPGLPVRIVETASYRLTSGLLVDANTTAIEVAADDVSIDLNGFTIRGPASVVVLAGGQRECSTAGSGYGILGEGLGNRTEVHNGSVIGISGPGGIQLGGGSRVHRLSVEHVCGRGIAVGITSSVVDSRSRLAMGFAILVGNASRVDGVIADFSGTGIATGVASTVSDSIATSNSVGILVESGSVVSNSTASLNALDGIQSFSYTEFELHPVLVVNSYMGSNGFCGLYTHPASGLGSNVFNGNAGCGSENGVPLQCNSLDGVNYCPSHP